MKAIADALRALADRLDGGSVEIIPLPTMPEDGKRCTWSIAIDSGDSDSLDFYYVNAYMVVRGEDRGQVYVDGKARWYGGEVDYIQRQFGLSMQYEGL